MDSLSRQREHLIALGRVAAGLAHEINNPASATARALDALQDACDAQDSSIGRLLERSLAAERFVALDALRHELRGPAASSDPLAAADREDAVFDWLAANDVDDAWRIAPALAGAGVDGAWCERAAEVLGTDTLEPGLVWVASTLSAQGLLAEMKQ